MAIYNREQYKTALPQLERKVKEIAEKMTGYHTYKNVKVKTHLCSTGTANACYKMGNIAFLFFNINITSSAIATAYLKSLPKPVHNVACCSSTARFRVDKSGELVSEEAPGTGWHNGSIAYICKE